MRLTDQQMNFFNTFGYLGFPGLFAAESQQISDAFEEVWTTRGGGHNGEVHDGTQRSTIVPFIDQHEYLCRLLDDDRVVGPAASILGDDFNFTGSDGNLYPGNTYWHSDGFKVKKYVSIKIAFYLDRITADTGCLRVIPGSHIPGDKFAESLHAEIGQPPSSRVHHTYWGVEGWELPAVPLEITPGDMVLFNHNLKHGAFGGGGRRRMFTLNMGQRHRDEDLGDIRAAVASLARNWIDRPYSDLMIRTAGPERMRHLEQILANADHLPELARKAREELAEPSRGGPLKLKAKP